MRKFNRSFFIAWSIIAVLVFANVAVAATTVGTSLSTTGTLTVTSDSSFANASASGNFELTGASSKLGIGSVGNLLETSLEVAGTASISGATTLGSTFTVTGLSVFSGKASVSINFEVSGTASTSALIVGGLASSSCSGNCVAQFSTGAATATTSVLFGGKTAGTRGTCLQMKDTVGQIVYCRVLSSNNTFTCSSVSCK